MLIPCWLCSYFWNPSLPSLLWTEASQLNLNLGSDHVLDGVACLPKAPEFAAAMGPSTVLVQVAVLTKGDYDSVMQPYWLI